MTEHRHRSHCGCLGAVTLVCGLLSPSVGCGDDTSSDDGPELPTDTSTTMGSTGTGGSGDSDTTSATGSDSNPTATVTDSMTATSTSGTTTSAEGTDTDSALCGNEMVDDGEACDDGNAIDGDGCNRDCVVSGTLLWTHTHRGGFGTDYGWGVTTDEEGNPYVAGSVSNATAEDIWLRNYSAMGGLGWTNTADGTAAGVDRAHAIVRHDETLFVAGRADGGGSGNDVWVGAYDLEGNASFAVTFSSTLVDLEGLPIAGNDQGHGIGVDPSGNPVVGGWFDTVTTGVDAWVGKLDPSGAEIWTATHNGDANGSDQVLSVAVDSTGAVIAAGWEQTVAEARNLWVRKYDAEGTVLWTVSRDGGFLGSDEARGVAVGSDDSVVVVGALSVDEMPARWWVGKYDAGGTELWTADDPGETAEGALARGVAIGPSDEIVVTGHQTIEATNQTVLRKYDADGTELWTQTVESPIAGATLGLGVTITEDGYIYAVGSRNMGIDGHDAWIGKYAP